MPKKVNSRETRDEEDTRILEQFSAQARIEKISIADWVVMAAVALFVQLVPLYYLHFVMEIYVQQFFVLVPAVLLIGAAALTYSYSIAVAKYQNKNQGKDPNKDSLYLKKEAILFALSKLTGVYLGLFLVFQWLISFTGIYSKIGTVFVVTGFVTSIIASL
ncbi:MAG: hypothetical protein EZS28_001024 [Streblomastix strix]|uniref:Uncharacterized protein n=1 Tax=Streblomastix strix TaxID=222440 RepID=A0A5J4X8H3_9EUKA|nr:MAG: hypothetical protein EZS28_001024 [Streblomastix strix]